MASKLRSIVIDIGATGTGEGNVKSYPFPDGIKYLVPFYPVVVTGKDDGGKDVKGNFRAYRFGIKREAADRPASVVGLAEKQSHVIKNWDPIYLRTSPVAEPGAWQVKDNFLIHDGPDDPNNTDVLYGSVGCIEICGPRQFSAFNELLISLSGSTAASSAQKLVELGRGGTITVNYAEATRPPLKVKK